MKFIELTDADGAPTLVRVDQISCLYPRWRAQPNGYSNPDGISGTYVSMANQDYSFWSRNSYTDTKARIMQAISSDNPGFY
ncbi:hypothetical protein HOV04_gp73 [Xanthomonas phage XcP1]|uniref:Uncharacterized protein n=1 Tax=Xanthomonas phage XcP1 TaxID=2785027 RepID=A0A3S7L8N6_9CAUD|nr:hypothetical protein HOV04_gp73 [Xanthomonas phage XcP1]AWN08575.1 hypothetical protein XcP1_073 [Xanthomonas phage XcP1]